jgi:hypothetical protein
MFSLWHRRYFTMPLSKKGAKVKRKMQSFYGKRKGERVFYASVNAGKIKGAKKRSKKR